MSNIATPVAALQSTEASTNPAAAGVVSHDTPNGETLAQGHKAMHASIEQLVLEREVWQDNAFRTSNEQLYGLLQRCYGLYKAMCEDSAEAKALREGLRSYIALKGHSFAPSTHTLTRIVKCVFGSDRRRVSAYSIVLRSALAQGVGVMDVARFIRDAGGVEEVRLAKAPNAMSAKQKALVTSSVLAYKNMGVFSSAALSGSFNDVAKAGTQTVLIGVWQADGSVVVQAVVESATALNAALASHHGEVRDAAKKQAAQAQESSRADSKDAAIQAATATAVITEAVPA